MTTNEKLAMLKSIVGVSGTEQDTLLNTYLSIAETKILRRAYPYDDTVEVVPRKYEMLQIDIAVYLYNKRGAEGETVHKELGVDRSYESGSVPDSMLKSITPMGGVV